MRRAVRSAAGLGAAGLGVMRLGLVGLSAAGLGLAGWGLAGSARAQDQAQPESGAPRFELLPIANPPPPIMFDPAPLSGTMLAPLSEAAPATAAATADVAQGEAGDDGAAPPAGSAAPPPRARPATAAVDDAPEAPADAAPAQAAVETAVEPAVETAPEAEPEPPPAPAAKPAPKPAPKPAVATSGAVTVIVEGVESSKGIVNVALCDTGLSEEGCPYTKATAASAGFVEARFADVPPGIYAVVGYHDVNNNDEFDKMFGVPREPYALSNKAGDKLVPTFSDAALTISKGENTVIIRLQRLMGG